MIDWQVFIAHPALRTLGWGLINALWIGTLLAGALWLALRLLPGRATSRYYACAVTLLMIPALVVVVLLIQRPWSESRAVRVDLETTAARSEPASPTSSESIESVPMESSSRRPADGKQAERQPWLEPRRERAADRAEPPQRGVGVFARLLPFVGLAYMLGLGLMALRLVGGWWMTLRLGWSGLSPLPVVLDGIAEQARRRSGVRRVVRFAVSSRALVPCVVGIIRPVVLLPASAVTGLTPDQVAAVFAHELAHVRRNDVLINLLQVIVETLLFFHPAVWWIGRRLRMERECCADDAAAATLGNKLTYAEALAGVARLTLSGPRLSLAATDGELSSRVRRLLSPTDLSQGRSSVWGAGLLVLAVGVVLTVVACGESAKTGAADGEDEPAVAEPADVEEQGADEPVEQQARVVLIDYQKLRSGDMRYNVVIRPGDVIHVPDPNAGFVYIMGDIPRPGAYTIPGSNVLSVVRLFASAGGLDRIEDGTPGPEVESEPIYAALIRQFSETEQGIYRFNLTEVMKFGEQDIYLRANDIINIGAIPSEGEGSDDASIFVDPRPAWVDEEDPQPQEFNGVPLSPVTEADLTAEQGPSRICPGDVLEVSIYELRIPGRNDVEQCRVADSGEIWMPIVGELDAEGLTVDELERAIAGQLAAKDIMPDASVTVRVRESESNSYSVFVQSSAVQTLPGTYVIPKGNFRLIEALTTARGISERTEWVYVIRADE